MGLFLLLVLVLLPLGELALLIAVAGWIGWINALLLLMALSVCGMLVLRRAGVKINRSVQFGAFRAEDMTDSFWSMLAGWLLLVPGFGTAIIGLLFLIPPVRLLLTRRAVHVAQASASRPAHTPPSSPTIIEGEAVEVTEPQKDQNGK